MVWLFVFMEVLVFGIFFVVFLISKAGEPEVFAAGQRQLNQYVGLFNTILLITSSYFVALTNRAHQQEERSASLMFLTLGTLCGALFLVVKGMEYADKIAHGWVTGSSTFFDFYWLLTAFHAAHVLFGLFLLLFAAFKIGKRRAFEEDGVNLQTVCVFWHMCDLIWVVLFPVLYLM